MAADFIIIITSEEVIRGWWNPATRQRTGQHHDPHGQQRDQEFVRLHILQYRQLAFQNAWPVVASNPIWPSDRRAQLRPCGLYYAVYKKKLVYCLLLLYSILDTAVCIKTQGDPKKKKKRRSSRFQVTRKGFWARNFIWLQRDMYMTNERILSKM